MKKIITPRLLFKAAFYFILFLTGGNQTMGQTPTVSGFSPASGSIGSIVTISGNNFNTTPSQNAVYFGAVRATVNTASANSLSVMVPLGATYEYISVTNLATALTAYSLRPFTVTFSGGAISFKPPQNQTTTNTALGTTIADIDGDGKPDLIATNQTANTISVFRNTSTGGVLSFAPKADFATGANPFGITTADFDGDGKLDVVVTNWSGSSISVLRNASVPGAIGFAAKIDYSTASSPTSVAVGDLNGDGKPDIVTANNGNSTISVLRNNSSGAGILAFFTKQDYATNPGTFNVTIGDLDGDGKPDIATANNSYNAIQGQPIVYRLSLFRNQSTTNAIALDPRTDITIGNILRAIKMADFDGDGKQDLVVSSQNDATAHILRNLSTPGALSFAASSPNSINSFPMSLAVGDIDGDGKADIAARGGNVAVLKNSSGVGNVSFLAKQEFSAGSGPIAPQTIAIGDLNGDGKPDIATCAGSSVAVLEQKIPVAPPTGPTPQLFCSSDFPTVANLVANGSNIQWFSNPTGGSPLASNTTLINNITYYASQTIDGNPSDSRLAVLVLINPTATWLGLTNNWNSASNWSTGAVPVACTRVVINNGTPFMPTVTGTNNSCFSVTLNNGATINMATGATLNITGKQ